MRSRTDRLSPTRTPVGGKSPSRRSVTRIRRWAPRHLIGLILLLWFPSLPATAQDDLATRAAADVVLVRENEIVDEDLYAGGNTITIEGTIEGDLIVWAFDRLDVSGTVEGDVIGYASAASITGSVEGSVRLVGFNLDMSGVAGGDLLAIAWDVESSGSVGRDLLAWANRLTMKGEVDRDIEGQTLNRTTIEGRIGRDVQMTVGELEIAASASVGQDVIYQSRQPASIDPAASVGGTITRRAATVPNVRISAARFVSVLLAVLAFVWIGMLMIWIMPGTIREASEAVMNRWARSLVVGLVALFLPLVLTTSIIGVAMLSPPDLTVSILAIGAPLCLALILLLVLGLIVAPVPVAIAVGRRILGRHRTAFAAYLIGIVLYLALLLVPYIGLPLVAIVTILGLGALARGAIRARGSLRWTTGEPVPPGPAVMEPDPDGAAEGLAVVDDLRLVVDEHEHGAPIGEEQPRLPADDLGPDASDQPAESEGDRPPDAPRFKRRRRRK